MAAVEFDQLERHRPCLKLFRHTGSQTERNDGVADRGDDDNVIGAQHVKRDRRALRLPKLGEIARDLRLWQCGFHKISEVRNILDLPGKYAADRNDAIGAWRMALDYPELFDAAPAENPEMARRTGAIP
jgi:hypothetical protein